MKILLVDDDEFLRSSIDTFLVRRGYLVCAAPCGLEALRHLEGFRPDLAISDIQMPGMDGIALLGAIRERASDLPVILMTDHASSYTAVAALRGRAYDYLEKPIRLEDLLACIEQIERRGAE